MKQKDIKQGFIDTYDGGWEYAIPEGYDAQIINGKIIVKKQTPRRYYKTRVVSLKKIETPAPQSGSGTGYSQPTLIEITCEEGQKFRVWVDVWYQTLDNYRRIFSKSLCEQLPTIYIQNFDDAFEMFAEAVAEGCAYTKDEILDTYKLEYYKDKTGW